MWAFFVGDFMAIQTINLTVPGGDTPRSANTKINANFSNQTHAASRLVGPATGQIPLAEDALKAALGGRPIGIPAVASDADLNLDNLAGGDIRTLWRGTAVGAPPQLTGNNISVFTMRIGAIENGNSRFQLAWGQNVPGFVWRTSHFRGTWEAWEKPYTDGNTTKEEGTGYLVASSPVLKMQHDSFEKVHEAEQLNIEIQNVKTGVYEITGTTGLREGDGWNLKPPKDVNGNVLCICEATEGNGVITLKTYKKKFDFETVSIVADYEQPTDIPEGAVVMLRFNDIPAEEVNP